MMRIAANCDEMPSDVDTAVTEISQYAGRHIRRVSIMNIGSFG